MSDHEGSFGTTQENPSDNQGKNLHRNFSGMCWIFRMLTQWTIATPDIGTPNYYLAFSGLGKDVYQ